MEAFSMAGMRQSVIAVIVAIRWALLVHVVCKRSSPRPCLEQRCLHLFYSQRSIVRCRSAQETCEDRFERAKALFSPLRFPWERGGSQHSLSPTPADGGACDGTSVRFRVPE